MCGRYTLTADGIDLWSLIEGALPRSLISGIGAEQVQLLLDAPNRRKYNIVPSSYEPILLPVQGQVALQSAHWWIAPSWAGKQLKWRISANGEKTFTWNSPPKSHFNSRWDTVTNPSNHYWHGLLENNRCLIPADGFMEWPDDALRDNSKGKIPHYFSLHEHRPFFFAGVYDEVEDDEGKPFLSYNIITVEPNEMLKRLPHHRMPAILTDEAAARWITSGLGAAEAGKLLQPTGDSLMVSYPISKLVNSPSNESSAVLLSLGSD